MNTYEQHLYALNESLRSNHLTPVHAGMYYYKGYHIVRNNTRQKDHRWSYGRSLLNFDTAFCETLNECTVRIDYTIAKNNQGGDVI